MVLPKRNSILSGFNHFPLWCLAMLWWWCNDGKLCLDFDVKWPNIFMHVSAPHSHIRLCFFTEDGICVYIFTVREILFDDAKKINNLLYIATLWLWFDKNDYCMDTQNKLPVLTFQRALTSNIQNKACKKQWNGHDEKINGK